MSPKGSIAELAAIIADNTKIVDDYLKSNGLSAPSFDVDGPIVLSIPAAETEVIKARQTVIASTEELNKLMKGPVDTLWSTFVCDTFLGENKGTAFVLTRLFSYCH